MNEISPVSFLKIILPDRGLYAAFIVEANGRKYNVFASSPEELWKIMHRADQRGHTAYHACATFKSRGRRTKENAFCAKSFWIDVDVKPNDLAQGYPDVVTAAQDVMRFVRIVRLPHPLPIYSGHGLQIYWPLNQTLERAMWERYAEGLKAQCRKHGLRADESRTADISSVLRTPGTHHRKDPQNPRLVFICG